MGFETTHAVNNRRLQAFCAGLRPFSRTPGDQRRYAVAVPCHNHAEFLPSAFQSVEAQSLVPSEVILVDDHSTDSTWRVINDLVATSQLPHESIRISRNSLNLGQCATINSAVDQAESNVIVVLNDDDYLMHDALEWIDFVFEHNPSVGLVGAKAVRVGSQLRLDNLKKTVTASLISSDLTIRTSDPTEARRYTSARQLDMCHSASAFFKDVWEAVGGYYPEMDRRVVMFSDRDFQLRVNCLCPVAVVEDAAFAFWRVGSSVDAGLLT
jgi:glycosyltransferase involved in cell wall biosynthesis